MNGPHLYDSEYRNEFGRPMTQSEYVAKAREHLGWCRHQRLAGRHRWAVMHLNRASLLTRVVLAWRNG